MYELHRLVDGQRAQAQLFRGRVAFGVWVAALPLATTRCPQRYPERLPALACACISLQALGGAYTCLELRSSGTNITCYTKCTFACMTANCLRTILSTDSLY